jgi:hypothetical protein
MGKVEVEANCIKHMYVYLYHRSTIFCNFCVSTSLRVDNFSLCSNTLPCTYLDACVLLVVQRYAISMSRDHVCD